MRIDQFFRGLLLAIRASGQDYSFLSTRGNEHHRRFKAVVDALPTSSLAADLSYTFRPNMLGLYRELETALLRSQDSLLGVNNPTYPGLSYKISETEAADLLEQMYGAKVEDFRSLAEKYLSVQPSGLPKEDTVAA